MKWFQHQSRAHTDAKLKKVLMKYGFQGYGLYWYCIENICATLEPRLTFDLEQDSEILAHEGKTDTRLVEEMMLYMVNIGLFEQSEGVIICRKIALYLGDNLTRNPELKAIIQEEKGSLPNTELPKGYIYFIDAMNGEVKIGYSANPWSRVKDIRSEKGSHCQIVGTFRGTIQHEKELHKAFSENRSDGEWFIVDRVITGLIAAVVDKKVGDIKQAISLIELLRSSDVVQVSQQEERRGEEKRGEEKDKTLMSSSTKNDPVPIKEIVNLYHRCLPTLPKMQKVTKARESAIKQRWREDLPELDNWGNYFDYISQSDFLMGRVEPLNGRNVFQANLEWISKASNYAKILEGRYHGI